MPDFPSTKPLLPFDFTVEDGKLYTLSASYMNERGRVNIEKNLVKIGKQIYKIG